MPRPIFAAKGAVRRSSRTNLCRRCTADLWALHLAFSPRRNPSEIRPECPFPRDKPGSQLRLSLVVQDRVLATPGIRARPRPGYPAAQRAISGVILYPAALPRSSPRTESIEYVAKL